MTDREVVEWVAQAKTGDAVPDMLSWAQVAFALKREIGFREPLNGEAYPAWCRAAQAAAREALDRPPASAD